MGRATRHGGFSMRRAEGRCKASSNNSRPRAIPPRHSDPFGWYIAAWCEPIERLIRHVAARLATYDPATPRIDPSGEEDLLGQLYQGLFPRAIRHELGEYYTPGWLADHVLDVAGYSGDPDGRLLDPACGSGTFLLAAIRRIRRWHRTNRDRSGLSESDLLAKILHGVAGFELNPLAAITARANYLMALGELGLPADPAAIPVWLGDSILDAPASADRFDFVVGNPPWIAWDNLPADYREATKPLWRRYGLFSLSGNGARHGGAKKDLAMLMIYASADRFLKDRGRLAMVITQTLLQSKGAGDGFRRFRLGPEGEPLKVLRVDDLVALRPFPEATNFTATIVLRKGEPTVYPVPYVKWSAGGDGQDFVRRSFHAEPIDPRQPGSPWFLRPEGLRTALARLVGPSDYVAHLGANSGGANGVYWVELLGAADGGVLVRNLAEKNRGDLESIECVVEPDLLHPLLRWSDVSRYRAPSSAHFLLAQDAVTRAGIDPAVMRRKYPKTYAYLERFEGVLRRRAAYRKYQHRTRRSTRCTTSGPIPWRPLKVVWRRMDRRLNAVVVEQVEGSLLGPRPVIPQETCVLLALESADEAHYACAVLNSAIVDFLVRSHSVCGGKGFGTPSMLDFVRLRRFDAGDPRHAELAACSRMAHVAAASGRPPVETQRRIDQLAAELWGLDASELAAIATACGDP